MRHFLMAALLCLPVCAAAQPAPGGDPAAGIAAPVAGTNMPPDFYPAPACTKPDAMPKPPGNGDADAMMTYNARVQLFNKKAAAFNACIKTYVDNAQNDIGHIQAIVHAAVEDANRH